jgi:hypothetical protein
MVCSVCKVFVTRTITNSEAVQILLVTVHYGKETTLPLREDVHSSNHGLRIAY